MARQVWVKLCQEDKVAHVKAQRQETEDGSPLEKPEPEALWVRRGNREKWAVMGSGCQAKLFRGWGTTKELKAKLLRFAFVK